MRIQVYGKKECNLCKSAQTKVCHFLDRWGISGTVEVVFVDMETEFGAAEGDFFDVFEMPSVLVMTDDGQVVGRWDGAAPPSEGLKAVLLPPGHAASAAA